MDDVRLYNYALSADEVTTLYYSADAIKHPPYLNNHQPSNVHTLDGIRLPQPRRGLNIIDGKIVVK